jgi:hypothetical protein
LRFVKTRQQLSMPFVPIFISLEEVILLFPFTWWSMTSLYPFEHLHWFPDLGGEDLLGSLFFSPYLSIHEYSFDLPGFLLQMYYNFGSFSIQSL